MCMLGQNAVFFPQIEGFMPLYLYSTALLFCNYWFICFLGLTKVPWQAGQADEPERGSEPANIPSSWDWRLCQSECAVLARQSPGPPATRACQHHWASRPGCGREQVSSRKGKQACRHVLEEAAVKEQHGLGPGVFWETLDLCLSQDPLFGKAQTGCLGLWKEGMSLSSFAC